MTQFQPSGLGFYRIQNIAYGSYLSFTDVEEGQVPRLLGLQDAEKQYWTFEAQEGAKNTYKIINATPNPEDIDTLYALNVQPVKNTVLAADADTKTSVWRIGISVDREHCSIITTFPGQPGSKAHLQSNGNGTAGVAVDNHKNSQKWRLIEVKRGENNENTGPGSNNGQTTQPTTQPTPQRIADIPDGQYLLKNILNQYDASISSQGYPCASRNAKQPPILFRYQSPTSPYFSMMGYGASLYIQETNGIMRADSPTPALWYLVKAPGNTGYYICPKRPGKMRAWNGATSSRPGIGEVFDTVPEILQGKEDPSRNSDLEASVWQRWWITRSSYPN